MSTIIKFDFKRFIDENNLNYLFNLQSFSLLKYDGYLTVPDTLIKLYNNQYYYTYGCYNIFKLPEFRKYTKYYTNIDDNDELLYSIYKKYGIKQKSTIKNILYMKDTKKRNNTDKTMFKYIWSQYISNKLKEYNMSDKFLSNILLKNYSLNISNEFIIRTYNRFFVYLLTLYNIDDYMDEIECFINKLIMYESNINCIINLIDIDKINIISCNTINNSITDFPNLYIYEIPLKSKIDNNIKKECLNFEIINKFLYLYLDKNRDNIMFLNDKLYLNTNIEMAINNNCLILVIKLN